MIIVLLQTMIPGTNNDICLICPTILDERRRLRESAVPSQFTFIARPTEGQEARSTRYNNKSEQVLLSSTTINRASMSVLAATAGSCHDCASTNNDNEICLMECELTEEVLMNEEQTCSEFNLFTIHIRRDGSV